MKSIEDQFQILVDMLETGRLGPLSPDEHRRITQFWAPWYCRNYFIDCPLNDAQLKGMTAEPLSQDQKESLESRWCAFAVEDGRAVSKSDDRYPDLNGDQSRRNDKLQKMGSAKKPRPATYNGR